MDLFDTPEKAERAIADFTALQEHPGWKLFATILDANIEAVREQLEEGLGETETKEAIDALRAKLRFYKEIRYTPAALITKLQTGDGSIPDSDPFETVDELRKRRQEASDSSV